MVISGAFNAVSSSAVQPEQFHPFKTNSLSSRRTLPSRLAMGGRSRSQAHRSCSSGASWPSSISTTYFPMTGRNLNPWKDPQVAM